MTERTKKNINELSMLYLTLIGLLPPEDGLAVKDNNPVMIYFKKWISSETIKQKLEDIEGIEKIESVEINKLSLDMLHSIIQECYNLYVNLNKVLDVVNKEQFTIIKMPFDVSGNGGIKDVLYQNINKYKDTLYKFVRTYNSKRPDYNVIKVAILQDRMNQMLVLEEYKKAEELKEMVDKYNELTFII